MNNINPIYNNSNLCLPAFKQKKVEDSVTSNPITSNASLNGVDALANYNRITKTVDSEPKTFRKANIEELFSDEEYMTMVNEVHVKRDVNGDGEVSVEETLAHDYLRVKYPDLAEKDREALIKYAMSDGNINVSVEEFISWLEGPEHGKILDNFKIREAEEIKRNRDSKDT